jgi:hypothetical protein
MMYGAMKLLTLLLLTMAVGWAQNADEYRGGWRTDELQVADRHTYEFSIRGNVVRGAYCTRCSDATTLAFIDGRLGPDGLTFTVTHVKADGKTDFEDRATARVQGGNLLVTGTHGGPGGGKFQWTMIKDMRGPDPLPIPIVMLPARPIPILGGRGGAAPAPAPAPQVAAPKQAVAPVGPAGGAYLQPAPWKTLKESDVIGVWLGYGAGINKQFFIIRKVGNKLRGMVCGRCDNPYTMAALDNFEIVGDTLKFDILHDDWGDYSIPFDKHVTAHVAANEMRISTTQDNIPPAYQRGKQTFGAGGASLMGPISIESTRGNP